MVVVVRSRTILNGGHAGRGGHVVLVLGNSIGVDCVGGFNIAIRGLRGRNGPAGAGSGGGRWRRDRRVMAVVMKNGTTGVSPVRSLG